MVSVSPAPGADGKYAYGAKVILTAVPGPGYDFKSWTGTSADLSNPTSVTINSDRFISVSFEQRFALTINGQSAAGLTMSLAGGSIALNPAPGTDGLYAKGTAVTLTVTAADGYRFDRWGGDAAGSGAAVTLNLSSTKAITAVFIRQYTLSIAVSPDGGGTVSPAASVYDAGSVVTLTATPAEGYKFDHWEGDAAGTTATIVLNLASNRSVTAVFIKVAPG
jgi:hypothetical protein